MPRPQLPKVGPRTIKTALAVMISYAIFVPFDLIYHTEYGGIWGQLGPSYACIACIICMQSSLGQTIYQGVSRFIGVAVAFVVNALLPSPQGEPEPDQSPQKKEKP